MSQILGKLGEAKAWLSVVLGVGLLLAISAVVGSKVFGLDLPFVRELGPVELAYLSGAYWLAR